MSIQSYYEFLKETARRLKPNLVVEIGTLKGVSANYFKRGYPEMHLITIDINASSGELIDDNSIIQLKGDSKKMVQLVPKSIDLLYIDGDHSYEGVKSDYELYEPLVLKGGTILVDDILESVGVSKFWKELGRGDEVPGVHGTHGMGIIHK